MEKMNPDRRRLVELAQVAATSREALMALVDARWKMTLRQVDLPLVELASCVAGLVELLDELPLDLDVPGAWAIWQRAQRVVQLLSEIGSGAHAAIPRLMFWMKHDPRGLGPRMAHALGRIGGDAEIRELNTWGSVEDRKLRDGYLDGLSAAGERAHETLLRITRDLNESPYDRASALESLRVAGYADRDLAVRALEMIADDPAEVVRTWAVDVLERLARDSNARLVLSALDDFERTRPDADYSDRARFAGADAWNRLRTTLAKFAQSAASL